MFHLKDLKLKKKLLFYILTTSFVVIGLLVAYLAVRTHSFALKRTTEYIQVKSSDNANEAQLLLEQGLNTARTMGYALEGMRKSGDTRRETAMAMMRNILERNPELLGAWTVWEPDAFDGQDQKYANTPGHDNTGRFIVYWNRGSGNIAMEACTDYTNTGAAGNYYFIPKNSDREYLGEPFVYKVQGKDVMMTSIAVPVHADGKVVGVAGVDISVETIQKLQSSVKILDSGVAMVISNQGLVVAAPDSRIIGQTTREFTKAEEEATKAAIIKGESLLNREYSDQVKSNAIISYCPIDVGNTGTPWSFVTIVPEREALAEARRSLWESLLSGFLGLIILGTVIWVLAGNISGNVIKGIAFAKEIAGGNLNAKMTLDQKDEIGELVEALNHMAETIRKIIGNILLNADHISDVSTHINASSQELSEGSTEQASAAEEVSSSMEQMASNTQQNADNAQQTAKITMQAFERIRESNQAGDISIKSMNEIAEKISIIGDIAFQTNILALNAAVESARAGEHGRGFAVVASEVRKLAERSKVAADAINHLSKTGVSVSRDAGQKLHSLIPEIEKTTRLIQEITSASMEQSAGAEQINNAIQQLSIVIQRNAETSQAMAKSSEELLELARELKGNIEYFKI